jgi:glycosyltransferase involved in cell wall biosynthesis
VTSGLHFRQVGAGYRAAKWSLGRIGVMGGCWYACRIRALRGPVRYLDGSDREIVRQNLAGSQIKVLTSSWEAAPLVLLETMAAGKPWVSTDVGCVRSWPGGIVCDSTAEMKAAVQKLMRDGTLRAELGLQGREAARNVYDWRQVVQTYNDVLV